MDISYFLHPFQTLRNKYYADLFRSEKFKQIVATDIKRALDLRFKASHGRKIDWDNPQTLDEKIMWLEGVTDTTEWSRLADKYEVRKYIEEKIGEENLTECYGVWDSVENIDYSSLPQKFVIKCTHDSGSTYIVKDKSHTNLEELNANLKKHMKPIGTSTCEVHYQNIKPRIIAEELLEDEENSKWSSSLIDYKIWCFNGKPFIGFICYDRFREPNGHISVTYDMFTLDPWEPKREYLSKKSANYKHIPRPDCLDEMLRIAKSLSEPFPQVRVDFYVIKGKPYFGELTFTSSNGINYFYSELGQKVMGEAIDLSNVKRIR